MSDADTRLPLCERMSMISMLRIVNLLTEIRYTVRFKRVLRPPETSRIKLRPRLSRYPSWVIDVDTPILDHSVGIWDRADNEDRNRRSHQFGYTLSHREDMLGGVLKLASAQK